MILKIIPDVVPVSEPVLLSKSSNVNDAAQAMHQRDIGAVLVMQNGRLAGIFTERDVSFRVIACGLDPARTTLGEVMTPVPQTVQAGETVLSALERMAEHHIRHLPISDGDDLVGVVALRDVLAGTMKQITKELAHMSVEPPSGCRTATDIMRNDALITLGPDASVRRAAELMKQQNIGAVLVMQNQALKGIFTERDVSFRVVSSQLDPNVTSLSEVMSTNPVTIRPGDSCEAVAQRMQSGHFRHLPIMDEGQPVGILSIRDLFTYMRHALEKHFETAMIDRSRDMISSP